MKFQLSVLVRSWTFWSVILVFAVANALSVLRPTFAPACCDQEVSVGFPFPFHVSGGIAGLSQFYVFGLLLDIVVPVTLAVLAVWIVRSLRTAGVERT